MLPWARSTELSSVFPGAGLLQGHCAAGKLPCSLEGLTDKHTSKCHQLWDNFFSPFLEVVVHFPLINVLGVMRGHYSNHRTADCPRKKCSARITTTRRVKEYTSHWNVLSPAAFSWNQSAEYELSLSELVRWDFSDPAWFIYRHNLNLSLKSPDQICLSVATVHEYFLFF